jgi:hypothetical protein
VAHNLEGDPYASQADREKRLATFVKRYQKSHFRGVDRGCGTRIGRLRLTRSFIEQAALAKHQDCRWLCVQ